MNKTAKGAFAAGAAAVLLAGGAGTLAYWNDTATVGGSTISSGNLKLDASSCTTAGWTVSNTVEGKSNVAFNTATGAIVPGDKLTKTCTVVVTAVGDNLRATLGTTGGGTAGSTMAGSAYTVTPTFKIGGTPITQVRSGDANKTIDVSITVDFPLGSAVDNSSKLKNIKIDDITVTATQATA